MARQLPQRTIGGMHALHGRFADDAYVITDHRCPRHWYNYLWNRRFVSLVSQLGQGEALAQDQLGRRIQALRGRMLFLRDAESGAAWSLLASPLPDDASGYRCTHAFGSTAIACTAAGIASTVEFLVPPEDTCEIWRITLENQSTQARTLAMFAAVEPGFASSDKPQTYYMAQAAWDPALRTVSLREHVPFAGAEDGWIALASADAVAGWETRWDRFIGFGTAQRPDAVFRDGRLDGSLVVMERAVLALQLALPLAPGERRTVHVVALAAESPQRLAEMRQRHTDAAQVQESFAAVRRAAEAELGGSAFRTPDPRLDVFASRWVKRQLALGTQWARVRHNGFRDLVQDIGAFAHIAPDLALERLGRVLAKQYSNGYAPRTWIDGRIEDKDFSDNHVWIPLSVHALLMETGDPGVLAHRIPFNDGSDGSLYEHARRAVEYLWHDRAQLGLCRMRSGDWDDCMVMIGKRGQGVSVWLSMAFCVACDRLRELALALGRSDDAARAAHWRSAVAAAIEAHAWDGDRWIRAIDDEGRVVGAQRSGEGTLFLTVQAWAVLAGLGEDGRARRALETVDARLASDIGTRCVENPYTQWRPDIGYMTLKPPGAGENGGVYLHASAFKLAADCQLKRQDAVAAALHALLPWDETRAPKRMEPFVFCNCYFAAPGHRYGTPGQSWGTGTAGWFHTVLLNHIYGLVPELPGLRLDPCLPADWGSCGVTRTFRGATYVVAYDCTAGNTRIDGISLDGEPFAGTHLPCTPGRTYQVAVRML